MEASDNPFAKVVLAHLKALETRRDPENRRAWKFRLVRGLYERGFGADDVRQLFRVIDWLMELPKADDEAFWVDVEEYEEGRSMPFVTSAERHGIKKGMLQMIERTLRKRFGEHGVGVMAGLQSLYDAEKLLAVHDAILEANTLDEVRHACEEASKPASSPRKKSRKGERGAS